MCGILYTIIMVHTVCNLTFHLSFAPLPTGVALPCETGEKRSGGGVKTIEGQGWGSFHLSHLFYFSTSKKTLHF